MIETKNHSESRVEVVTVAVCEICNHPICPFCTDWCDTIIYDDENDGALCCDGECKPGKETKEVLVTKSFMRI